MNPRLALYQLLAHHAMRGEKAAALIRLSGLADAPPQAGHWLQRGLAVLAAALFGLGVIMWVAANWSLMSRGLRFGLLEGLITAMASGACLRPAWRTPLLLLAFLLQGSVLAFFGQTYQTGADPWQLFALWCALGLPFALAARNEVLWLPLALVAMTAIALWSSLHDAPFWRHMPTPAGYRFIAWGLAALLAAALAPLPALQAWRGASLWSFRLTVLLGCILIGRGALSELFFADAPGTVYPAGIAVCALASGALILTRLRDVFALSALALCLDTLLICGAAKWLLDDAGSHTLLPLFVLTVVAAGLVGLSVVLVLRVVRQAAEEGGAA